MRKHRAKPPNVCNAWAHTRTYIHAPYIYRSKCQNHYPMAHLHHDERIYDTLFCVLSHIICIYKTATRTEIIRKIYLRPFVTHTQTAHKQRHTLTHTHTHECVRTRRKKWPDRWGKLNTKKEHTKGWSAECRTHTHTCLIWGAVFPLIVVISHVPLARTASDVVRWSDREIRALAAYRPSVCIWSHVRTRAS